MNFLVDMTMVIKGSSYHAHFRKGSSHPCSVEEHKIGYCGEKILTSKDVTDSSYMNTAKMKTFFKLKKNKVAI
jgi:hypothetical protein